MSIYTDPQLIGHPGPAGARLRGRDRRLLFVRIFNNAVVAALNDTI
jgi:hypothetical protein